MNQIHAQFVGGPVDGDLRVVPPCVTWEMRTLSPDNAITRHLYRVSDAVKHIDQTMYVFVYEGASSDP